jgi:hypothetical protein
MAERRICLGTCLQPAALSQQTAGNVANKQRHLVQLSQSHQLLGYNFGGNVEAS